MKPCSSLRTCGLVAALLVCIGGVFRLAAQSGPFFVGKNGILVTPPLTRTYTGTVVRTTAPGVTATGTITLSYYKGGGVVASTVVNGVTNTYSGTLVPTFPALLSVNGKETKNSGVLSSFDRTATANGVVDTDIRVTAQLPVVVDKRTAFGGFQNADGSTLTFRAIRDAK